MVYGSTNSTLYECYFVNETENATESDYFLLNGIITTTVCVLGLFTNLLSLVTLTVRRKRAIILKYLIALSLWDSSLLVASFLMYAFPTVYFGHIKIHSTPYIYYYPVWYFASNLALMGTVWTVAAMTTDRYVALCHPMWKKIVGVSRRRRSRRVTRILVIVFVIVTVFQSPRFFELTVSDCLLHSEIRNYIGPRAFYVNSHYKMVYKILGGFLFGAVAPFAIVLGMTIRIYFAMKAAHNWRSLHKLSSKKRIPIVYTNGELPSCAEHKSICGKNSQKAPNYLVQMAAKSREKAKTKNMGWGESGTDCMLLTIAIKFLLSHCSPVCLDIAELIMGSDNFKASERATWAVNISNFVVVLDSSMNFWIFLALSKDFRKTFVSVVKNIIYGSHRLRDYTTKSIGPYESRMDISCSSRKSVITSDTDRNRRRSAMTLAGNYLRIPSPTKNRRLSVMVL